MSQHLSRTQRLSSRARAAERRAKVLAEWLEDLSLAIRQEDQWLGTRPAYQRIVERLSLAEHCLEERA